jgi:hypothetical protein
LARGLDVEAETPRGVWLVLPPNHAGLPSFETTQRARGGEISSVPLAPPPSGGRWRSRAAPEAPRMLAGGAKLPFTFFPAASRPARVEPWRACQPGCPAAPRLARWPGWTGGAPWSGSVTGAVVKAIRERKGEKRRC